MKIFLLGYMGSGKSTIGKALSLQMDMPFIDMDDLIEAHTGMSIPEIFERDGEGVFRKIESALLKGLKNEPDSIIACGGGTPCFFDNLEWMKANGLTLYLKLSPIEIVRHLKGQTHRPILKGKSEQELLLFIEQHLMERSAKYEQAQVVYRGGLSLEETVDELRRFFQRF